MMLAEPRPRPHAVAGRESPTENEGFRSKPVLTFWMMAARAAARSGVAHDGGYSGEMVRERAHDDRDPPAVHPVRGARASR